MPKAAINRKRTIFQVGFVNEYIINYVIHIYLDPQIIETICIHSYFFKRVQTFCGRIFGKLTRSIKRGITTLYTLYI